MLTKTIILTTLFLALVIAVIFVFQNLKNKEEENLEDALSQQKVTLTPGATPSPTPTQTSAETKGLKIEVLKQGSGEQAKIGDKITVHYTGVLSDGTKFDSSVDRGQPFVFTLGVGQVIKGWDQGILGMKVGEKRALMIPPDLGYGAAGTPGGPIPPNATLIFEVELLKVEK